jgi:hypothetical protein
MARSIAERLISAIGNKQTRRGAPASPPCRRF